MRLFRFSNFSRILLWIITQNYNVVYLILIEKFNLRCFTKRRIWYDLTALNNQGGLLFLFLVMLVTTENTAMFLMSVVTVVVMFRFAFAIDGFFIVC